MSDKAPRPSQQHGDIFSRSAGTMLIHVQRQNGLAHRTLVLRPWQVQLLRIVTSRWVIALAILGVASWSYFAVQAARVPILNARLAHLEEDARRLDTLQQTLATLQARYEQVQKMMSTTTPTAATRAAAASATVAGKTKAPEKVSEKSAESSLEKTADKSGDKARNARPDSTKKPQP